MQRITERPASAEHVGDHVVLGIVTVSDRASQGTYEDGGGRAILSFFEEAIKSPWSAPYRGVHGE